VNLFSQHPKLKFKVYTAITLVIVVVCPWSATALNRPELNLLTKESLNASTKTEDLIVKV